MPNPHLSTKAGQLHSELYAKIWQATNQDCASPTLVVSLNRQLLKWGGCVASVVQDELVRALVESEHSQMTQKGVAESAVIIRRACI